MKTKKIKLIALFLTLFMLIPLFLACGDKTGDTPDPADDSPQPTTTQEPEDDPAAEPVQPVTEPEPTPDPEPNPEPVTEPEPAAPVTPEEPPYANMIAMYNMEGELKNAVSGATGTLWNGASFVDDADRGGKVLYLNNDGVETPGSGAGYQAEGQWAELAAPYIPDSDAVTVSIWFKVKEHRTWARAIDLGDAKAQNALADGSTETVGPDRFINISPTNGDYTIGTFNCNDMGELGVPNNRDRVFADLVDENKWVHAVYVVSKDGKPNVMYINGVAFESTNGGAGEAPDPAGFSPKDILAAPEGLRNAFVGRSAYENNGDQIFNGYIDDIAIFSVALTANQVAGLMAADSKN